MKKNYQKINKKLNQFIIFSSDTIFLGFQKMSLNKKKFLIVIDKMTYKTLGTITDGDIRRSIWAKVNLDNPIQKIMNKNFFFLEKKIPINKIVESKKFNLNYNHIPILQKGFLRDIIFKSQIDNYLDKKIKSLIKFDCMIMAGGYGKRLLPYTKILPKPLLPFTFNEPVISKQINYFLKNKVEKINISLGYQGELIESYLNTRFRNKKFNFIKELKPLGTVGSLRLIKKINNLLILINCDTLTDINLQELLKFHKNNKNDITIVSSLIENKIPYGVCNVDKKGNLQIIKEKPSYKNLALIGLYVLSKKTVDLIPKNERFDFDQLVNKSIKKNLKIKVYPIAKRNWKDVGTI